ncbi:MAG: universal stress protein [Spirochaetaceae bacterium]|jgi:nucleotide-binding universal stress UspA family protein|nr:universal stress protein [Spirochaetaceae bacterium]
MIKPLFERVLVAHNGSQPAVWASKYGILMAHRYGCTLKAVYVVDTATLKRLTISKYFVQDEFADYEKNLTEDGKRFLNYVTDLGKQKKVRVQTELRQGAVLPEIIASAVEMNANLILLGGYADDRIVAKNTLAERHSVEFFNQEIIANAPCSVLVVREKMIDQLFKLA